MGYVYQEFPRWLYKASGERLLVASETEKDTALADGWQLWPVVGVVHVTPTPSPVPRRGRPPKVRPAE